MEKLKLLLPIFICALTSCTYSFIGSNSEIKYENSDLFEISAEDLFNDENDYSRFKTAWVDSGEIVSIY